MKTLVCFLVFACILAAVPAFADSDLTIFGAAQHQGKLNLQTATSTSSTTGSFDPRNFGVFGIRYGHGKIIGGEHTLAYAPNFIISSSRAFIYNSNLRIQADLPKVKPYGTVGLGAVFTWSKDTNGSSFTTPAGTFQALGDMGTKFAINYGGGVAIMPAGPVGVKFDIRGYTLPSVSFNVASSIANQTVKTANQNVNLIEFGFGIVFKIGK